MSRPPSLTDFQAKVYEALINLDDPKSPRMVKRVCAYLGAPSSSVYKAVKALEKKDLIRPANGAKYNAFYVPHKFQEWIKLYIDGLKNPYGGGITAPAVADGSDGPAVRPYVPTVSTHLTGRA